MTRICQVCIPHTHKESFSYLAEELDLTPGARVRVPFRDGIKIGLVIAVTDQEMPHFSLKAIAEIIDEKPIIPPPLLSLCQWMAGYYQSPLSEVIPLALPKKYRQGLASQLAHTDSWQLALTPDQAFARINARASKQKALIEFLITHPIASQKQLTQAGLLPNTA